MELAIDFEELVEAFEESDVMHHFFIDTKNNELIYINEDLDEDAAEQLEKMEDDRYLMIPPRLPQDNFLIMELFVYEKIQDDTIAEKFDQALERKKPFRNFKDLLLDYPSLREQWFIYHHEHLKNETINWLCTNNLELTNQCLIPDIEIRELTNDEISTLSGEITDFGPVRCMDCQNVKGLVRRLFLISVSPENTLIEQETKQIMEEKFNITHYGWWSSETPNILTVSRCPKCHSEHIIWDY
jgi:ribosomal protein S27E